MTQRIHRLALLLIALVAATFSWAEGVPTAVLYNEVFSLENQPRDILLEGDIAAQYTAEGLQLNGTQGRIRLDRYYSLGHRTVRYVARFAADAVVDFGSDTRDFVLRIDVAKKQMSVESNPRRWTQATFLNADDDFLIQIEHRYATNLITLSNLHTGEEACLQVTTEGEGGCNAGAVCQGYNGGFLFDYNCVSLAGGSSVLLRQMSVVAGACNLTLLIYGDSITQPEGYFPSSDFPGAWTQLIMNHVHGPALASGRGGCTINEVLRRIPNELPYLRAKYVMVTIGTNGGNTEENLSQLVEYILSQGSIPILNNIPCNELNDQVAKNEVIERVRRKYNIQGCRFDVATSMARDGKEVDKSTMWFENLIDVYGRDIYHHPNVKGSHLMYLQTLLDVPQIYD